MRLVTEVGTILAHDVTVARSTAQRVRGLRGRDLVPGQALVLVGARQVHTFGLGYGIDVVFCDHGLTVVHAATLAPRRISRFVLRARLVVELPAGIFPPEARRLRFLSQPGRSSIPVSNAS